jgi:hypothetical protein
MAAFVTLDAGEMGTTSTAIKYEPDVGNESIFGCGAR